MVCGGKSYVRLLQRSTRGPGSEEHLEGQPCELSFSMLETVEERWRLHITAFTSFYVTSVMCSRRRSEVLRGGAAIIEEGAGRSR